MNTRVSFMILVPFEKSDLGNPKLN